MRIKVPVEMLYEAASRLSKMEATLAQDSSQLVKIWNSLPLESRSKQAMDTKISQVRSLAGRLSSQANSLGNYLNLAGMRFVEADRHCSVGISNSSATSKKMPYYTSGGDTDLKNNYCQVLEEREKLNLGLDTNSNSPSNNALPWIGTIIGTIASAYSSLSIFPGSGEAGLVSEAIGVKGDLNTIIDGTSEDSDLYDVGGVATGVAMTGVAAGKIGSAAKIAIGTALVGKAAFAATPILVPMAIGIGTGIAVAAAASALFNASIGGDSITGHISSAASDIYRSAGEVFSKVGSGVTQAKATVVAAVSSGLETAGETVGSAINSTGEVARGFGERLKFW